MSTNTDYFNLLAPDEQSRALALYAGWFHNRPDTGYEDVAALLAEPQVPLEFLVDGLLARGHLAVLSGRPKCGKSWLALQLARAVDTGRPFLGRAAQQATVLYAALEDGRPRFKRRCHALGFEPTDFKVVFEMNALDDGRGGEGYGLSQVEEAAERFDLVILDTLPALLSGTINENDNAAMGAVMRNLVRVVHQTGSTILLVHHANKGFSEDPFSLTRGASAVRGGYDFGLHLQRKTDESEAVLNLESRDGAVSSLTIRQLIEPPIWEVVGAAKAIVSIRAGRKVLAGLAALGDGATVEDLAEYLKISKQAVHQQLKRAESKGHVKRSQKPGENGGRATDLWSLTDSVDTDMG